MKAKEVHYFRIKIENPLMMSKARKLIYMTSYLEGASIYKTIAFDNKEDVTEYLECTGCVPVIVSKLSLQNI